MLRFILAAAVLGHGIGHVLFLGPALRLVDWAGQTSHSWLLTTPFGDAPTRAVGAGLWSASLLLFVAGVGGYLVDTSWWRAVTIAGAVVSLVGIVAFWDGLATSNALLALAFDVLIIGALLVAHWPATAEAGI